MTRTETVTTRYVGPSNTHGSYFVVRFRGHVRRVPYSHDAFNAAEHAAQWTVDQYVESGHVQWIGTTRSGNRYSVSIDSNI